eukprot:TRINITY_DN9336_c0_g4_i1.p1 TRINITY_DN9336_c0_g4~~TRINITY_DN9336_c0_g4_i1.p1  ORF type:complete len:184 (-),score=22.53 TRINITY_DN9336_c0_g4_i1:507-1058(-)
MALSDKTLTWVPKVPPLSCEPCRFTTDSHTAFRAHCSLWRHCKSRIDRSERVPSQFVDPRHADPERFAQLPAARQWAALRRHVSAVLRQLRVPLADARVRANMERLAESALALASHWNFKLKLTSKLPCGSAYIYIVHRVGVQRDTRRVVMSQGALQPGTLWCWWRPCRMLAAQGSASAPCTR